MDREEILLKEYETCQSHNNALGQQSWVSLTILITVNMLLIGQVAYQLFPKSVSIKGMARLDLLGLLAIVMVVVTSIFWRWYHRIRFLQSLNNDRMQEIENVLEMWKNWRVRGLDLLHRKDKDQDALNEWKMLFPNQRKYIKQLDQRLTERGGIWKYRRPTTEGFPKFDCIFPALIFLWVLIVWLEALLYIYPKVGEYFFSW